MEYVKIVREFFSNYGWEVALLALSGIVLLGFLKWIGIFKKVPDNAKKYVYFGVSCGLSIIICTIYVLAIGQFDWLSWLIMSVYIIFFTLGAYGIYENTGLRKLVQIAVLNPLSKLFKLIVSGAISKEQIKEKALQLGSQALEELVAEAKQTEENKKNEEIKVEQGNTN